MRCFIGIPITGTAAEAILSFQKTIHGDVKFVEAENLHICLKFLEEVPESKVAMVKEAMREAIGELKSFGFEVTGAGGFPNERMPRVIWAGVKGDFGFQQALDDKLAEIGFKNETREFRPHITIGRVRLGKVEIPTAGSFGNVSVTKISLIKSELGSTGPIYTDLFSLNLK